MYKLEVLDQYVVNTQTTIEAILISQKIQCSIVTTTIRNNKLGTPIVAITVSHRTIL
jgi:hypothetical protein